MANPIPLKKLNRFIFFADEYYSSSSSLLSNPFSSIFEQITSWLMIIPNFFVSIISGIANFFLSIIAAIANVFHSILTAISTFFYSIFTAIPNFFHSIFATIANFFHSIISAIANFFHSIFTAIPNLLHKLDQAVPPETRVRILTIGAWCLLAAILLVLFFCFMSVILNLVACVAVTCWNIVTLIFIGIGNTCHGIFCCCVPATVKMMKAPGMAAGELIGRASFEAAPRVYFAALRAGSLVVRGNHVILS